MSGNLDLYEVGVALEGGNRQYYMTPALVQKFAAYASFREFVCVLRTDGAREAINMARVIGFSVREAGPYDTASVVDVAREIGHLNRDSVQPDEHEGANGKD